MYAPTDIAALARSYAAGELTWPRIPERYNVHFGDLLLEVARQCLRLRREVDPERVARLAERLTRFEPERLGGEMPLLNT